MKWDYSGNESPSYEGIMTLAGREIEITDASATVPNIKLNILNLYNLCASATPCLAETFMTKLSSKVGTLRFTEYSKALLKFTE
jgi:hypothetical protein